MTEKEFDAGVKKLFDDHYELISRQNVKKDGGNGIYDRYRHPVLTRDHTPVFWRYDLNYRTNPHLMTRLGINTTFNAGAIKHDGKYCLAVRTEGFDVKSFFAIAESPNGTDHWRFRDHPIVMPVTADPEMNVYDIRLTRHEDGWIYGLFCAERKDHSKPDDSSAALASCGIARTMDLERWERLDDLRSSAAQQRNCVLHPEFVNGKYMIYTRPQSGFIETGDSGISAGFCDSMEHALLDREILVDARKYHTVKEVKNGQGPAPLKTEYGWIHLAHGVRRTAAGLRYTLYLFMTSLEEPWKGKNGIDFKFKDKTGSLDGITSIIIDTDLSSQDPTRVNGGLIKLKGKGVNLPVPALPLAAASPSSVTVQFMSLDPLGMCASATTGYIRDNTETKFKANQ